MARCLGWQYLGTWLGAWAGNEQNNCRLRYLELAELADIPRYLGTWLGTWAGIEQKT